MIGGNYSWGRRIGDNYSWGRRLGGFTLGEEG
jgi:hypothetical protein